MAITNVNPVEIPMLINIIIDLSFIAVFAAPAIWLFKKEQKKRTSKNDLLRQEIEELQAKNNELLSEQFRLQNLLLIQSMLENLKPDN